MKKKAEEKKNKIEMKGEWFHVPGRQVILRQ